MEEVVQQTDLQVEKQQEGFQGLRLHIYGILGVPHQDQEEEGPQDGDLLE